MVAIDPKIIIEQYKTYISLFMLIAIILVFLFYISHKMQLKKISCDKMEKIIPLLLTHTISTEPLNTFFIKTAYNCCCTGNFQNDYVDLCSLKNCANQGVRALDFQVYSLKDRPIISASSVTSKDYKEIYNYLEFYDAMKNVKRYFLDDPTISTNHNDPLFLIFRLYSANQTIYDSMGDTLNDIFGYANPMGNLIYFTPINKSLDAEILDNLSNKVIIIVDPTYGNPAKFESSKLNWITSLKFGTQTNNLYRENETLIDYDVYTKSTTNLSIIYPDLGFSSINYDFITTGIFNNISFIGMNFQRNDKWLKEYNTLFNINAFIDKDTINEKYVDTVAYNSYLNF
jgi:hypothetical protein